MEKVRNIRAMLAIEKNYGIEELFRDITEEYFKRGISKQELASRMIGGELEGVFDNNVEAFMRKSKLRLSDDFSGQEIADIEMTDFCAEDICYFISNIKKAVGNISEEYSELFDMLELAGFDYSADGYMLPNLFYIDDIKVNTDSRSDINIILDAIISATKVCPRTSRTSKVMIACYPENENVRRVMRDRCFMSVGHSNLMLYIVDTERIEISGYKPCEPSAFM